MRRALIFFLVIAAGLVPRFRRIARTNLRIAFGPAGPGLYLKSLVRLADTLCAILKACRKNPDFRPRVIYNTDGVASCSIPPPWVLVTAHLGPIELMGRYAEPLKTRMAVVVRPPKNWALRQILAFVRRRIGTEVIEKQDVLRESVQAMTDGKSVAIMADHNAGYNGVFLPFLGSAASTTRLPAVLALKFRKPIVMGFIRKDGPEYLAWIEKVIVPDAVADDPAEERRLLGEMNAVFTDVIRRYPEDWFWFHRRWKTRPGDKEAHILR